MYYYSEYKDRLTSTIYAVNTKPYTINSDIGFLFTHEKYQNSILQLVFDLYCVQSMLLSVFLYRLICNNSVRKCC